MDPDITGNPGSSYCMRITIEPGFRGICVVCLKSRLNGGLPSPEQAETSAALRICLWLQSNSGYALKIFSPRGSSNDQAVIIRQWKEPKQAPLLSMAFQCSV